MIPTLREIVARRSAKTLFFQPPAPPVVESLEGVASIEADDYIHHSEEIKQFSRDRLVVDMQTANVIVMVYDAMKPEARLQMDKMMTTKNGFVRVGKIAWSCVKAA